ncbi:MAG TPA: TlpA family protein disulfide reductase [Desulfobulbaceae bacterium]|nr:TlpA family protein disulfide reductase [Desulfobulbaceae bacterium]
MKKRDYLIRTLIAALALAGLLWTAEGRAATKMPSFALENVRDGKIVDSNSFKGQVLLLTFFATWCPPCLEEVPTLVKLHKEMEGAGFSVIGMSVDQQEPAIIAKFVEKKAINYPVLLAESKTTMDFGGIYGIPVAFLVNKAGNVVKKYTGYVDHAILEKDIRSLL